MLWDDVRIFLAVARGGGFVTAARRLGLDHTTVARRINALETATESVLLHRSPRGSKVTEAGLILIEHAERMEAEAVAAAQQLGSAEQQLAGAVRLATPEAFGASLVAPAMKAFHDRHPGIHLELAPEARAVSLSKREADIAVTLASPPTGRLFVQKLTNYRLGLYASKSYLESASSIETLDDLRLHPLVWYIDEMIDFPELRFLDQVMTGLRPAFRSSSITAQQTAVASGLGLGILHRFAAEMDPRLVRLLPDQINVERSYWLVVHADQRHLPRIRAVVDFLHGLIRQRTEKL
jgi:DNA-binding transcriptional LysR family regulator